MDNKIMKLFEVAERDKERVHSARAPRPDFPETGNVFLVGFPGSGREEIGRELATRLGGAYVPESQAATMEQLRELASRRNQVVALSPGMVEDRTSQKLVRGAGRVFYRMAPVNRVVQAVALREGRRAGKPEELRAQMVGEMQRAEPFIMQTLHFLIPEHLDSRAAIEDVIEKLKL